MPVLHVAMPVFDEGPTLSRIVDRVMGAPLPSGWSLRLVMVDDGSRPEAARVVREARERGGSSAELLVHPMNRGKGAALLTAFDHVLAGAADADAVLVQDADLEYDPADDPALLGALAPGTGAVFGNRWAGTRRRVGHHVLHPVVVHQAHVALSQG
ncbi:MAG: glycosyltransferase, partial [Phycisphaerales bacterium]